MLILPDGENAVSREKALVNTCAIVEAVHFLISADLGNGYGIDLETVLKLFYWRAILVFQAVQLGSTKDIDEKIWPQKMWVDYVRVYQ